MTATILPFPILRRHGFIQKQAAHAACMNPIAAARYIEYQIQVQRDAMRRRGVATARPSEILAQRECTGTGHPGRCQTARSTRVNIGK